MDELQASTSRARVAATDANARSEALRSVVAARRAELAALKERVRAARHATGGEGVNTESALHALRLRELSVSIKCDKAERAALEELLRAQAAHAATLDQVRSAQESAVSDAEAWDNMISTSAAGPASTDATGVDAAAAGTGSGSRAPFYDAETPLEAVGSLRRATALLAARGRDGFASVVASARASADAAASRTTRDIKLLSETTRTLAVDIANASAAVGAMSNILDDARALRGAVGADTIATLRARAAVISILDPLEGGGSSGVGGGGSGGGGFSDSAQTTVLPPPALPAAPLTGVSPPPPPRGWARDVLANIARARVGGVRSTPPAPPLFRILKVPTPTSVPGTSLSSVLSRVATAATAASAKTAMPLSSRTYTPSAKAAREIASALAGGEDVDAGGVEGQERDGDAAAIALVTRFISSDRGHDGGGVLDIAQQERRSPPPPPPHCGEPSGP